MRERSSTTATSARRSPKSRRRGTRLPKALCTITWNIAAWPRSGGTARRAPPSSAPLPRACRSLRPSTRSSVRRLARSASWKPGPTWAKRARTWGIGVGAPCGKSPWRSRRKAPSMRKSRLTRPLFPTLPTRRSCSRTRDLVSASISAPSSPRSRPRAGPTRPTGSS